MEYGYLLSLALILLSTKIFGLVTKKVRLPQVVGALLAGLILGPACFGVLKETDVVSVRGHGKFICDGISGETKKGNLNIQVSKYV